MRVVRGREGANPSQRPSKTFSGEVRADSVLGREDGAMVLTVVFSPGARTHWHSHERGQVLFITHGRGLVCTRDGDRRWVTGGDVVHFPPGEEHWHGAGPDTFMVHTAVSMGATDWLTEVTNAEYVESHA
jgi:quercetin dioxygenase-like cupin family protein